MQWDSVSRIRASFAFPAAVLLALPFLAGHALAAPTLKTLYSFCQEAGCADGNRPTQKLTMDGDGNLFGTTEEGGTQNAGVVFELVRNGDSYTFRKLYDFCSEANCADGSSPETNLILDMDGNLYGTTAFGGPDHRGTVFKLAPNRHGTKWKLKTLYGFCRVANCIDGDFPVSGLTYQGEQSGVPYDGTAPLYGATAGGGDSGAGTVFRLTFTSGKAKEKTLYSFCPLEGCGDGRNPVGGPILDAAGNLYGLTGDGGVGHGTAYKLSADQQFAATAMYQFCRVGNCDDGLLPMGRLTIDGQGNFFGATENGGLPGSNGVLFKLSPKGGHGWKETTIYDFCSKDACSDGGDPNGDLAMDADGNLFGSAFIEGAHHNGVIFKFGKGKETVLYPFCSVGDRCSDGSSPIGSVILDAAGNIFGTASAGGTGAPASGTVFELTP